MNEVREQLDDLGKRILGVTRTQLLLSMPFLKAALLSLDFAMDLSTRTVGTDGAFIRFNPRFLYEIYLQRPGMPERAFMHMLMHCLFLHLYHGKEYADGEIWDLCCDIAAESVIDSLGNEALRRVDSDFREEWYERLSAELPVLTAERLYQYFMRHPLDEYTYPALRQEFLVDDHIFWQRLKNTDSETKEPSLPEHQFAPMVSLPLKETWEKAARHVRMEAEQSGAKETGEKGTLSRLLKLRETGHPDFAPYLAKFAVWREEVSVDPENFDLAYYSYGMQLYGNMPLIEGLEMREAKRVNELAIAIDTSASTQRKHVQKFLNQTLAVLKTHEAFFKQVNIHIIECDDRVQSDIAIKKLEDFTAYADGFEVRGGYGTDFRPVFSYLAEQRRRKQWINLRGLLYFTDGHGTYPAHQPSFETAFIFCTDEDYDDTKVPPWALKLYIHSGRQIYHGV